VYCVYESIASAGSILIWVKPSRRARCIGAHSLQPIVASQIDRLKTIAVFNLEDFPSFLNA
jgi:hypothetical protein